MPGKWCVVAARSDAALLLAFDSQRHLKESGKYRGRSPIVRQVGSEQDGLSPDRGCRET
jgi:hypothetical protein